MNIKLKTVHGVLWSALESWGQRLISAAVFFALARLLEPEAFGLVALSSVFLDFLQLFIDQGFSQAIVQRKEIEEEHLNTAFWVSLSVSGIITVCMISIAGSIAHLMNEPLLKPVIRWLSVGFILAGFSKVQEAILIRNLDFKSLSARSLTATFLSGIVGIAAAIGGLGVWSLVLKSITHSCVRLLMLWHIARWRPGLKISLKHFRELFSFGANVIGLQCLNFFYRRADDFLIGYYLGTTALGTYSIAYRLLLLLTESLMGIIQRVSVPAFSRMQNDINKLRKFFSKLIHIISLFSFPIFSSVALTSPEIVNVFFGEQWQDSISVMRWLAILGIIHSLTYLNSTLIVAIGKPGLALKIRLIETAANIAVFFLVFNKGIVAVSQGFVAMALLTAPISIYISCVFLRMSRKEMIKQYISPLLVSSILIAILGLLRSLLSSHLTNSQLLIVTYSVGSFLYLFMLYYCEPILIEEITSFITKNNH